MENEISRTEKLEDSLADEEMNSENLPPLTPEVEKARKKIKDSLISLNHELSEMDKEDSEYEIVYTDGGKNSIMMKKIYNSYTIQNNNLYTIPFEKNQTYVIMFGEKNTFAISSYQHFVKPESYLYKMGMLFAAKTGINSPNTLVISNNKKVNQNLEKLLESMGIESVSSFCLKRRFPKDKTADIKIDTYNRKIKLNYQEEIPYSFD